MAVRFSDPQVVSATGALQTRRGPRASFTEVCTDSRQLKPGALFVALRGEKFDAHDFLPQAIAAGAEGLIVARGRGPKGAIDCAVFEVDDTLKALGGLARYHRLRFRLPLGAVTGSNGKTTTKELIASILSTRGPALKTEGNLNNEVGVPLTLFGLEPRHVAGIVEMGMNHPGEIGRLTEIAQPDAGLITVVQPAHLEGVGTIEGVANAKGELFRGLKPGATAVVNLDDHRIAAQAARTRGKALTFGRTPHADVQLTQTSAHGRDGLAITVRYLGKDFPIALRLVGDHNAMNATAAFALCVALGYHPDECVRGLESAQAHARRLEVLTGQGGVTVVDDCYNANPASMAAALDALTGLSAEGRPVAVLGDMLELGEGEAREHTDLGVKASDSARLVAFFGPRMVAAHATAAKKLGADTAHFTEVGALLAWLQPRLHSGDVVLVKGSRGMRLERVVDALVGTRSKAGGH
jgi:UDP-N-acetylmuramoyl-tripeptide--D-alanyl-D-alanine ligase